MMSLMIDVEDIILNTAHKIGKFAIEKHVNPTHISYNVWQENDEDSIKRPYIFRMSLDKDPENHAVLEYESPIDDFSVIGRRGMAFPQSHVLTYIVLAVGVEWRNSSLIKLRDIVYSVGHYIQEAINAGKMEWIGDTIKINEHKLTSKAIIQDMMTDLLQFWDGALVKRKAFLMSRLNKTMQDLVHEGISLDVIIAMWNKILVEQVMDQ